MKKPPRCHQERGAFRLKRGHAPPGVSADGGRAFAGAVLRPSYTAPSVSFCTVLSALIPAIATVLVAVLAIVAQAVASRSRHRVILSELDLLARLDRESQVARDLSKHVEARIERLHSPISFTRRMIQHALLAYVFWEIFVSLGALLTVDDALRLPLLNVVVGTGVWVVQTGLLGLLAYSFVMAVVSLVFGIIYIFAPKCLNSLDIRLRGSSN